MRWLHVLRWLVLIIVIAVASRLIITQKNGLAILYGLGCGSGIEMLLKNGKNK
ncbi:hypothetical protein HPT25_03680 [Bacillus sp. BRMEA1]|uniref:hypothetical protein n=1 Tax=Neobacillus endophyticus TaxID=2738405 RepID=UPI001563C283|nr:hypothetical protein [Neobacillus endophyticus]NRD76591.1 hypothetical protein [Neobacillus endophyticus]